MKKLVGILVVLVGLISAVDAPAVTTVGQETRMNKQFSNQTAQTVQIGTRIRQAESVDGAYSTVQSTTGTKLRRVAKFTYDARLNSWGSSTYEDGVHSMGVTIPGKAIITRSYFVVTQVFTAATGANDAKIAFQCETANNIKTATDIDGSSSGDIVEGESTGAASAYKKITADCDIKAKVTVRAQATGRAVVFVEYVVAE